ncbi:MAG: heterodisulfide reductase-related iron-sulfur binding cluster [Proteobacteria bacterium]|nr:heterodisulfide reductase-related iron-sulfur binding cluster [Pseudomonadota bacterium]
MNYGYYPGCSLTGSARKLDKGVRAIFRKLGHSLNEIPDWNCCGALEYGDRNELIGLSRENLKKAEGMCREIVAPCPACYKNLKEANSDANFEILNPLELLDKEALVSLNAMRDLKGKVFTPYYGCVLLRPEETAIRNKTVMEDLITFFGGEIEGEKIKDRCCGGNQFFANKWATEKLSTLILEKSRGVMVVFCPLCHMALKTFSTKRKIIYLTDLLLYLTGDNNAL